MVPQFRGALALVDRALRAEPMREFFLLYLLLVIFAVVMAIGVMGTLLG